MVDADGAAAEDAPPLVAWVTASDVKLLMAFGAWSNYSFVLKLAMVAIVVGAIVGLFVLLRRHGIRGTLGSLAAHLKNSATKHSNRIPFGPAFRCAFAILTVAEIQRSNLL